MKTPSLLAFLLTAVAATRAATPVTLVSISDSADTARGAVSFQIREVRDLRTLGALDPHLLGSWSPLPFEERTALRTSGTVAEEVLAELKKRDKGTGIPVRIDLLSFETWSDPVPGPDPVRALVHLRVVSLDSARPGLLLEPRAKGERKMVARATEQTDLLRSLLHDALDMVKPPFRPSQDTGSAPLRHDRWADPSTSASASAGGKRALRQILSGTAFAGKAGVAVGARYTQFLEPPSTPWVPEYWGGFQLRGPWDDDEYDKVWSGELQGGLAWHRRLDAGASDFVVVGSAGGLLGIEGSRKVHDDGTLGERKTFVHVGVEGRFGVRMQPVGPDGISWSAGPQLSLRLPSRLGWFDPGVYGEFGWRF